MCLLLELLEKLCLKLFIIVAGDSQTWEGETVEETFNFIIF